MVQTWRAFARENALRAKIGAGPEMRCLRMLRWRLVASNGRPVGYSPVGYADEAAAHAAFLALVGAAALLPVSVQHSDTGTGWVWQIANRDGEPVAASTRRYERNATCWLSYRRFLKILPASTQGNRNTGR